MTSAATQRRLPGIAYAVTVTPLLRWLIAHHTVPFGTPWRTRCDRCATPMWPAWCAPTGYCPACRTRIGAPAWLVEGILAAMLGLLTVSGLRGWELAAYIWWTTGLAVLAFVDAAVLRLPFRLTAATAAGTVVLLLPVGAPAAAWWSAVLGAAGLATFYAVIHAISPDGLGLGDVVLAVPVGLGVGWVDWRLTVATVVLGHLLAVSTILARRIAGAAKLPLPLGVYLAAAAFTVVVGYHLTQAR